MEAVLINLHTEDDDCLGAYNSCRSTIRAAVYSRLFASMPTLYEACRASVMSLRGDNDCKFDSAMAAVHRKLLSLRGSVDAVRVQTKLPSVTDPQESDSGEADPRRLHGSAF